MSQIEQAIIELVQRTVSSMMANMQQPQAQPMQQQPVQQFQQPVQQFQQPVQQFQQPQGGGQITPDMIQSLIGPLVATDQGRAAVIAAMQSVGVQNLTEARPDQLPALWQAFQNVAAQMQGGGMAVQQFQQPVQQQPQGGMSII